MSLQRSFEAFPKDVIYINKSYAYKKEDNMTYFFDAHGLMFMCIADDKASFKIFICQLYLTKKAKIIELSKSFNIKETTIKSWVKKYSQEYSTAFNKPLRSRSSTVMTPEKVAEIQKLLDSGMSVAEISKKTKIKSTNIYKSIQKGNLKKLKNTGNDKNNSDNKSERVKSNVVLKMGNACHREIERLIASKGLIKYARSIFESNKDVQFGGLLVAISGLIHTGLYKYLDKYFSMKNAFYSIRHIVTILTFLYFLGFKSPENIRGLAPGELGLLIGLDRAPEVKTLRSKLSEIASFKNAKNWLDSLSKDWLNENPDNSKTLYVDGHLGVYNGKLADIPKSYVSRQKLCLRGKTDYWVNDSAGNPFFFISKEINPGLRKTILNDIVPILKKTVPDQPTEDELENDKDLFRFMLVFDREGYSPDFFAKLWEERVAFCSYKKYDKTKWDISEFKTYTIETDSGKKDIEMKLAERKVNLSDKIYIREIRKLTDSGHQTIIITTNFKEDIIKLASLMFSRWSQENFFKYMRECYGLDRLIEYGVEAIDPKTIVTNPEYRDIQKMIRKLSEKLKKRQSEMYIINEKERSQKKINVKKKEEVQKSIETISSSLSELKQNRKEIEQYIQYSELPDQHKFLNLPTEKKMISNILKMICYRSESWLSNIIYKHMSSPNQSRTLLREVFNSTSDIEVDKENQTLTVSLHNLSSASKDRAVLKLFEELNKREIIYPGTSLKLKYQLLSNKA